MAEMVRAPLIVLSIVPWILWWNGKESMLAVLCGIIPSAQYAGTTGTDQQRRCPVRFRPDFLPDPGHSTGRQRIGEVRWLL